MNQDGTSDLSALMAGQILAAMRDGDLARLETGLERAQALAASQHSPETNTFEQLDLLDAVAGQMRESITRFGQRATARLEGFDIPMSLLRHLAGPAHRRRDQPCRVRAAVS